jgi:hypothetical protein
LHLQGVEIISDFKEEREEYSEPDDPELGRVDVCDVRELDWMAPEALRTTVTPKARRNDAKSCEPSYNFFLCLVMRNIEW